MAAAARAVQSGCGVAYWKWRLIRGKTAREVTDRLGTTGRLRQGHASRKSATSGADAAIGRVTAASG